MPRPTPPLRPATLAGALLWAGLGTGALGAGQVRLLSSPAPFQITAAGLQPGETLRTVDGGPFDLLLDPGPCDPVGYSLRVSRQDLNWPAGVALRVRAESAQPRSGCKNAPAPLLPLISYTNIPATGALTVFPSAGALIATLRYQLDFTGHPNPMAIPPGVYVTDVTYTITAP